MPIAIEMYFDQATDAKVRQMWSAIADLSVPSHMIDASYRPHVTLAVCDELDHTGFAPALERYVKAFLPLTINFPNFGIFPGGVVFLGVTVTTEILTRHALFHDRLFRHYTKSQGSYYLVGNWVPHCTLAFGLSPTKALKALKVCYAEPLPISATVNTIGVVNASPTSCSLLYEFHTGNI
jgi:2'-5' RNA ligase